MTTEVFDPLRIGSVEIPNRIALAPVKTAFGPIVGLATDRHTAYYRRRAEGGAGLIIVEPLYVTAAGKEHPKQLGIDTDDKVPGLSRIVEAVHAAGAGAFAHLNHAGRAANPKASGLRPEAPSPVICPSTGATPEEMEPARIEKVVEEFREAARRAREAGFDGVEIQFGLGYLIAQFLSARTNLRRDAYGGDFRNRLAFGQSVLTAVREGVGPDVAVTARISAKEQVVGGLDLADALSLSADLEERGIDAIHVVTGAACDSPAWYYQHMSVPRGENARLAGRVRDRVRVPVLVAGRMGSPGAIRSALRDGLADAVALGRPLVADPDLPRKMREGRESEIRECGSCLQACLSGVKRGKGLECIVNPEVGRVGDPLPPAGEQKSVLIVGGGPAGLTAAITARRRGFEKVRLLERSPRLGGQFALSFLSPGKESLEKPFSSLVREAVASGAEILTGREATADEIAKMQPDEVILATGSRPSVPRIEGLSDPLTGEEVLMGTREVGRRVLVLGGGLVGIEVAEFLGWQSRRVVVVEALGEVARDMEPVARKLSLGRLAALGVEVLTSTTLARIEDGEAHVVRSGNERSLGRFDSFVVAVGVRPRDHLKEELEERGLSVRVIGDALHPGQAVDAVLAGYESVAEIGEASAESPTGGTEDTR